MIGDDDVEAIVWKREAGSVGEGYLRIDVAVETGSEIDSCHGGLLPEPAVKVSFGRKMQDLFAGDRKVFGNDGFEQALPVFAEAIWTNDVVAVSGDNTVGFQCAFDLGGGIFRDEFLIFRAAIVAGEAFPAESIPGNAIPDLFYVGKRTPVEALHGMVGVPFF